jgi:hypothetical protein
MYRRSPFLLQNSFRLQPGVYDECPAPENGSPVFKETPCLRDQTSGLRGGVDLVEWRCLSSLHSQQVYLPTILQAEPQKQVTPRDVSLACLGPRSGRSWAKRGSTNPSLTSMLRGARDNGLAEQVAEHH